MGVRGQATIWGSLKDKVEMALEGPRDHETVRKYYRLVAHRLPELSDKQEILHSVW